LRSSHGHHVGVTDGLKLEEYKNGVASTGVMFIPTMMKICQLVLMLLRTDEQMEIMVESDYYVMAQLCAKEEK
jgi:hypothetical protein